MAIKTHMLTLGAVDTNCYIVGDTESRVAVVIDAPDSAPTITRVIAQEGWTLREILVTHAHFDHVLALGDLKAATGATIRLHRADLPLLQGLPEQMRMFFGTPVPPAPEPDGYVEAGDVIEVGGLRFEVRYVPGHAPGHVAYVLHEAAVVFSGDCLFEAGIGRTDLPGGDLGILMRSIFDQLLTLPEDYTVACGHGRTTTLAKERATNPYVLDWAGM